MKRIRITSLGSILLALGALLPAACSSTPSQPTTRTSDAAMKDPYGKWSNVDTDITGGKTSEFNKDAFNRDLDHFLLK